MKLGSEGLVDRVEDRRPPVFLSRFDVGATPQPMLDPAGRVAGGRLEELGGGVECSELAPADSGGKRGGGDEAEGGPDFIEVMAGAAGDELFSALRAKR